MAMDQQKTRCGATFYEVPSEKKVDGNYKAVHNRQASIQYTYSHS